MTRTTENNDLLKECFTLSYLFSSWSEYTNFDPKLNRRSYT